MRFGPLLRAAMPARLERCAARWYRRIFVDLDLVAECLARELPLEAKVLDIGGGDGELLNVLLAARPDLTVTMVDIAETVGRFLQPQFLPQVRMFPATTIEAHLERVSVPYSAVVVCDVLHHIPNEQRHHFMSSLARAMHGRGSIFVKDVEPGHVVASAGLYADRYISGDRGVSLVPMSLVNEMAGAIFPASLAREVGLYSVGRPNYLLRIDLE